MTPTDESITKDKLHGKIEVTEFIDNDILNVISRLCGEFRSLNLTNGTTSFYLLKLLLKPLWKYIKF